MDIWVDEWMGGWMDGWYNWINGWIVLYIKKVPVCQGLGNPLFADPKNKHIEKKWNRKSLRTI